MKRLLMIGLFLTLAACATRTESMNKPYLTNNVSLPDTSTALSTSLGPAPELTNETWLNVDSPLRLADLRGKVVGIEMWTFGCINCQHVIPALKEWDQKYRDQGLVIIGNHYPEFDYEASLDNIKAAVKHNEIKYAVALDNDGITWRAYKNRYWPTLYLIDKRGNIRYVHIGEGGYEETEAAIQTLLAEEYSRFDYVRLSAYSAQREITFRFLLTNPTRIGERSWAQLINQSK